MIRKTLPLILMLPFIFTLSQKGNVNNQDIMSDINSSYKEIRKEIKEEEKEIHYNRNNVREPSNLDKNRLYKILEQKPGILKELSDTFIWCEEKYNVNALFLVSIAALESDWGRSERAKDNNLTGMAVYNDNSKGYSYPTKNECIVDLARQLDKFYLTKDATYFNGYSSKDINKNYCEKKDWYKKIDDIARELLEVKI